MPSCHAVERKFSTLLEKTIFFELKYLSRTHSHYEKNKDFF